MDFVQDALYNGERLRVLTVVDNCTGPPGGKICLGLLPGKSLKGSDVVAELSRISLVEGCFPERIQCDNGSEFIRGGGPFKGNGLMRGGPCRHIRTVLHWTFQGLENRQTIRMLTGSPERSFNGKFRDECLSVNWFLSLDDAREKIEDFRWEYNHFRSHSALNDLTPKEFVNLDQKTPETLLSTVWIPVRTSKTVCYVHCTSLKLR